MTIKTSLYCEEIGAIEENNEVKFYARFTDEKESSIKIFFPEGQREAVPTMLWKHFDVSLVPREATPKETKSTVDTEPEKRYCFYVQDDESWKGDYTTRDEAIGGAIAELAERYALWYNDDKDIEVEDEIIETGVSVEPFDQVNHGVDRGIDWMLESIDEDIMQDIDVDSDHPAIELSPEDTKNLKSIVAAFLEKHIKFHRWTVAETQKHTITKAEIEEAMR